jgi:acyl-CoA synthetase (NDP forming)
MEFFFKPRGIAVVGATVKPKGGLAIVLNLVKGFSGGIYPVNPGYPEIAGLPCYPGVRDVPDPVDLAIVFVPAPQVPDIVTQCAARGIRGIMIESAGFAETGPLGERLQEEVRRIATQAGIRIWGPNCMGIVDAVSGKVFSFVSPAIWEELIPGRVSLIVQSGMLSGGFLVDTMSHGTMGVSKVCSIGNKMDVNECDLLEYLLADPDTGAVGLYLESVSRGREFYSLCRNAAKPIVVLKGGKSPRGAEAARSHTASLAGNARVLSGMLAQAGVVEATDFKQMMDLCRTLALVPPPPPAAAGRAAILTYSGGAGILSADFLDRLGLATAVLSPETRETLKTVYPEWMPVANPVDLWPAVERHGGETVYRTAVRAVCGDPGVDAVLLHVFVGGFAPGPDVVEVARTARESGKPVFLWLLGSREQARTFHLAAQDAGIPVFRELFRAVECMAAAFAPGRRRREILFNLGKAKTI